MSNSIEVQIIVIVVYFYATSVTQEDIIQFVLPFSFLFLTYLREVRRCYCERIRQLCKGSLIPNINNEILEHNFTSLKSYIRQLHTYMGYHQTCVQLCMHEHLYVYIYVQKRVLCFKYFCNVRITSKTLAIRV